MGTPLGPKYIPYTYMDPLGKIRVWVVILNNPTVENPNASGSDKFHIVRQNNHYAWTNANPSLNPPPHNRDYNGDPYIQALKRRRIIHHGSTLGRGADFSPLTLCPVPARRIPGL